MFLPASLENIITEAAVPHLDAALVSAANVSDILLLSRLLPHWRCAGFECRLGNPIPRADFGVHLTREIGLPTRMWIEAGNPGSLEVWRRLHRFNEVWADTRSPLAQTIPAVSLEFDINAGSIDEVAPSIFFSIHPEFYGHSAANACSSILQTLLEVLAIEVPVAVEKNLQKCLRILLPNVPFLQFGIWLGRHSNTYRICAPSLPLDAIQETVSAMQWDGPSDAYQSQWCHFANFTDKGTVHIDVGDEVTAKLGIEVHFDERSVFMRNGDSRLKRFFDYLVANSFCIPEKRDAVSSWVGAFKLGDAWSVPGTVEQPMYLRTISHVKMVFQPDQLPEAKVYLCIGPTK